MALSDFWNDPTVGGPGGYTGFADTSGSPFFGGAYDASGGTMADFLGGLIGGGGGGGFSLPGITGGGGGLTIPGTGITIPLPTESGGGSSNPASAAASAAASSGIPSWLLSLLGIGAQVGGTAINAANRGQALQLLQQLSQGIQGQLPGAQFAGQYNLGPASQYAQSVLSGQAPYMQLLAQSLLPNIQQLNNILPNIMGSNTAVSQPATAAAMRALQGAPGLYQNTLDRGNQIVNNMGATQWSLPLLQQAQQVMYGQGAPLSAMANTGTNLLQNLGQNPANQQMTNVGNALISSGGFTDQLANAINSAQGLVNTGGVNPQISTLSQLGKQLSNPNPLLPLGLVASFAQDQAARNYANQAKNMRSQLAARGQGPGDIVASGAGTSALADFADQALPGMASALQNALTGQQGLQLQQTGLGANTQATASGQAINNLQNALAALSNLTNTATGRMNTGAGLMGTGQNLQLQGTQLGGNLADMFTALGLQGGNLANNVLGTQNQQLGMGLNAALGAAGGQTSALNQIVQNLLTGSGQGIQLGGTLGNLYLGNQGALSNAIGQGLSAGQAATGALSGMGSTWLDYARGLLNQLGNTTGQQASILTTGSPWASLLSNLGAAAVQPSYPTGKTPSTGTTGGNAGGGSANTSGGSIPDFGGNFVTPGVDSGLGSFVGSGIIPTNIGGAPSGFTGTPTQQFRTY